MDATPAERPRHTTIEGRYITLQPLNAEAQAGTLFDSVQGHDSLWEYMSDGPFPNREAFRASIEKKAVSTDSLYFAIIDNQSADAVGYASYLRIEPSHRVIEVGNILYTFRKPIGRYQGNSTLLRVHYCRIAIISPEGVDAPL